MEGFWKAAAVILLAVILGAALEKTEKDISLVLTIAACCIVMSLSLRYLSEVIAFLWELGNRSESQIPFMGTLLKISGVALMTEITELISADSGRGSLGKAMQILGNAAILSLSLPIMETFFTILQEIIRIP